MAIFEKKESNEDYKNLKNSALNGWNQLVEYNPFAPLDELSDRWSSLNQQINKAYKMSQKFSDTEQDVPLLKRYLDDSTRRLNEYSFEVECGKFKTEYFDVCNKYKELIEKQVDDPSFWNDNFELMTCFDDLYKRATWVLKTSTNFNQFGIDQRLIKDIISNSAFYYCGSILRMTENKETEPLGRARDQYYQYLRYCERTAKLFNEGRFIVIRGVSCERRALFCQETSRGSNDMYVVNDLISEAKPCLKIVENHDYCLNVVEKYTPGYGALLNYWDWYFMIDAVSALTNVYKYEGRYNQARNVLNIAIEAHQRYNIINQWDDVILKLISSRNSII